MERKWIRPLLLAIILSAFAAGCCRLPTYTPAFWNDGGNVQYHNNCYNYGNNKRTDTYAQPGKASGITLTQGQMYCNAVKNAAIADGILPLPASGVCPKNIYGEECKVALFIDPDTDYHWYRLDQNGMWTHKPGGGLATNLDNSFNPISNPETANRCGGWLCYTDFCGYMCSCSSNAEGQGHEKIR